MRTQPHAGEFRRLLLQSTWGLPSVPAETVLFRGSEAKLQAGSVVREGFRGFSGMSVE